MSFAVLQYSIACIASSGKASPNSTCRDTSVGFGARTIVVLSMLTYSDRAESSTEAPKLLTGLAPLHTHSPSIETTDPRSPQVLTAEFSEIGVIGMIRTEGGKQRLVRIRITRMRTLYVNLRSCFWSKVRFERSDRRNQLQSPHPMIVFNPHGSEIGG